ncbi:MAG: VWA domain-containing protein [Spirochaetaceae bacterium]|jgi:hypothetical protein|nr:VWA domain-containing protein [Spirochaetaceae bacterium]
MTFRKYAYKTAFFLLLFQLSVLWSERIEAVDLYIAVDNSLSIEEEGLPVSLQKWLSGELTELLIPGDTVRLYSFYSQNDFVLSVTIRDGESLKLLREAAEKMTFDRNYTDIGNAINSMRYDVQRLNNGGRRPILFVLTDLIQEAPPGSRYEGLNRTFVEDFLSDARRSGQGGWYVVTVASVAYDGTVAEQSRKLYNMITSGAPRRIPDDPVQGRTQERRPFL